MLKYIALPFIFLLGCSEYNIEKIRSPEIEVNPVDYNFEKVLISDSSDTVISVQNIGDSTLKISSIELIDSSSTFSITSPSSSDVAPGDLLEILVTYAPNFYESNEATIVIKSNDSDEPRVYVDLVGSGSAPIIKITPESFDFGLTHLGCGGNLSLNVKNIGDVDLEITDIDFLSTIPSDFDSINLLEYIDNLPIILSENDSFDISLDYAPTDLLDDAGIINIYSNDPITPMASATQDGVGDYGSTFEETFVQDQVLDVDILFVVDNSGSMGSFQSNLSSNFYSFISAFVLAGADYQIAFITTDDPMFVNNSYVTSYDFDPVFEATLIIDSIGTSGSPFEAGLEQAYLSTQMGFNAGIDSDFLRADARFVLIFISDEGDFASSISALDLTNHLLSLKSTSDLVMAHAVAGDYPSGCSTGSGASASFGSGYYSAVNNLVGSFMSICSSNWGADLETVATESILIKKFELLNPAIEASIEVYVDGALSVDWVFEESTNSIIFNTAPDAGSEITVYYSAWEC